MLLHRFGRCLSVCPWAVEAPACLSHRQTPSLHRQTLSLNRQTVRGVGHRSKVMRPIFQEFNERRKIVELNSKLKEENTIVRRSSFLDWNYPAELYGFSARLGESIQQQLLQEAFTSRGYIEAEVQRQRQLGIEDINVNMKSNERLSEEGEKLMTRVVVDWLRGAFPYLPEEGVQAVKQFLLSEDLLAEISFHTGTKDLILSVDYPPTKSDYVTAFKAVVGSISSGSVEQAEKFVKDLVLAQLADRDINEIWRIDLPMTVLSTLLRNQSRGEPEPRLLWTAGSYTLLASFTVGIYSDKQLVGQFSGESMEIAEEMAARDALRRLFCTAESMRALPLHTNYTATKPNPSIQDWTGSDLPNLISG